jgi:hypothetical protein
VAAETAAIAVRASRLAAEELAAARAEVEAAAAADAARAAQWSSRLYAAVASAALPLPTMTPTWNSSRRGKQRESGRRSGQPITPTGAVAAAQTGLDESAALLAGTRAAAALLAAAAGSTEIADLTGGAALPPRTGAMVTTGSRWLSGTLAPAVGGLPSPRPTMSSGPR